VWSPDWWYDAEEVTKRLDESLVAFLEEDRKEDEDRMRVAPKRVSEETTEAVKVDDEEAEVTDSAPDSSSQPDPPANEESQ